LITFNLFSLLNFIFNISMARMLSLAEYGSLMTLMSVIIIFTIFSDSIQTIISKYSTQEKDLSKIKNIIKKSLKKATKTSFIIFILFLLVAILFSFLFKINYLLIALTGTMIFAYFLVPIIRGVMQGKKKFTSLGLNFVFEGGIKLVFAIFLVYIGWNLYGAMLGVVLGAFGAFALSFIPIKDILNKNEKPSKTPDIYNYSKPVFVTLLAITLFLSLDIIIAKIFFSPNIAGAYAISSTIAKIIFIGVQPISRAMFPFTTESKNNKDSKKAFLNAFFLIAILISIALILIFFFSDLIILLYAGKIIPQSSSILIYLAIAMSLLSFTNLILFYKLSKGNTKIYWVLLIFILVQIILLSIFNANLFQFSIALITASVSFLWGSILLLSK